MTLFYFPQNRTFHVCATLSLTYTPYSPTEFNGHMNVFEFIFPQVIIDRKSVGFI